MSNEGQTDRTPRGKIAVGECDECGYLMEPDIKVEFPHTAECRECGTEMKRVKLADESEVKALAE